MKLPVASVLSLSFLAACAVSASDLKRIEIALWPGEVPGPEPKLEAERDTTKDSDGKIAGGHVIRLGNVSQPGITVYPAPKEKANGAAVLVCPGGGYHILALDLEGTEVCERLNEMGFTAVLLKYRVPRRANRGKHDAPLQDAQRAMSLIRQGAEQWGIDPKRIGVLGFSAGGHLAAVLSNGPEERAYPKVDAADEQNFRPNFAVLIYPGNLANEKDLTQLSPELKINKDSPQAFIAIAADDPVKA